MSDVLWYFLAAFGLFVLIDTNLIQRYKDLMPLDEDALTVARLRRAQLAEEGFCVNGRTHGPRTHGVRCIWCAFVHKHGLREAYRRKDRPEPPPGHQPKVRRET